LVGGERIPARDDPQRGFSGDRAQLLFDASGSASAPIFAIASTPGSSREPCAAIDLDLELEADEVSMGDCHP
jgi:hypothetical protein